MHDSLPLSPYGSAPSVSGQPKPPTSSFPRKTGRFVVIPGMLLCGGLSLLLIFLCDQWITRVAAEAHSSNLSDVPVMPVGLVLGCSEFLANGNRNLYFRHRIEAALELYRSGKCRAFLVSGDHGRSDYNEPGQMKAALVRGGIPEDRIHCDYAGFRTLDSVVRAKEVFGLDRFLIVSQAFHNERALFLARENGIDAFGYDAEDVRHRAGLKTRLREKVARVKTILDTTFLGTQPRYLGTPITIPEGKP